MLIDGHQVAATIYERVRAQIASGALVPQLAIVTVAPNSVTKRYLARKEAAAATLGISCAVTCLEVDATTEMVITAVQTAAATSHGVLVQLPLPEQIDRAAVVAAIPSRADVDALRPDSPFLSPVVGAIREILTQRQVSVSGQAVVVIGAGALVGAPAAAWCREQGAQVTVITEDTPNPDAVAAADIIIAGAGQPGLVQPEHIKDGVVLLDAATAELHGKLQGDIAPACAAKASYMTPVPGGIGPITIAVLLEQVTQAAATVAEG